MLTQKTTHAFDLHCRDHAFEYVFHAFTFVAKLNEHKATGMSVQTSTEGPGMCNI